MKRMRRSISIPEGLYERSQAYAKEFGLPMSQLAEQAFEALLTGRIGLAPARTGRDLSGDTASRVILMRAARARRAAAKVRLQPICAICTGPTITDVYSQTCASLQPLGPNDALVTVCHACNTVPAGDPRYVVSGESIRPGMADGANWARNRRVG